MRYRILYILIFILTLFSSSALAQGEPKIIVSGTVYVIEDNDEPLNFLIKPKKEVANVQVEVKRMNTSRAMKFENSNGKGDYSISIDAKGKYRLCVNDYRFKPWVKNIDLSNGLDHKFNIELTKADLSTRTHRNCTVPYFLDLPPDIQAKVFSIGVSEIQWNNKLDNRQRLLIFNILAAIDEADIKLEEVLIDWSFGAPIHKDRIYLEGTCDVFKQVEKNRRHFSGDAGRGSAHEEYSNSFRRNVFYKSMQMSFTEDPEICEAPDEAYDSARNKCVKKTDLPPDRIIATPTAKCKHYWAEIDIDIFNPNLKGGYVLGSVLHFLEVYMTHSISRKWGWSGQTDAYSVGKENSWDCLEKRLKKK